MLEPNPYEYECIRIAILRYSRLVRYGSCRCSTIPYGYEYKLSLVRVCERAGTRDDRVAHNVTASPSVQRVTHADQRRTSPPAQLCFTAGRVADKPGPCGTIYLRHERSC
eukprot:scaffold168601_cov34-Prasinocladus_malaysianus.AAC.1